LYIGKGKPIHLSTPFGLTLPDPDIPVGSSIDRTGIFTALPPQDGLFMRFSEIGYKTFSPMGGLLAIWPHVLSQMGRQDGVSLERSPECLVVSHVETD